MLHTPYLIHRYLFYPIYIYDWSFSLGMMRQKLITLDPTSWELAQKKKNFSEWVRKQLRLEVDGHSLDSLTTDYEFMYDAKEYWMKKYNELKAQGESE